VIHDYNQYQPTSEISEARSEAGRRGGLASGEARRNQETKQIASSKTNQNAEANEPPSRPVPSRPEEKDLSLIPTEQDVLEFDLDAVYEAYPRKKGKTPGMKIAQREIRTRADYAAFDAAVKSYAAEVTGRKPDHVLYFSTFMNQWRDYIPKGETSTQGAPAAETPLDRMTRENKEARRLEFFGDEK
jgi:hypothetical protein